jgi:NADP-dependent 3-hydroxy acid dehydrogenase YdfG
VSDKVFLITGASTGIGAATARLAAQAGFRLVLAARSTEKLKNLAAELGGDARALAVECDVTDWRSQQNLVARTLEKFGRIDVVFANAGTIQGSRFLGGEDTPEEWREMVLTNIYGVAATARLVLPELVKQKGHLLVTGSVVGRVVSAPGSLYSPTKWAVTAMSESIRQAVVGTQVRVTLIGPGLVNTPFWSEQPTEPALLPEDVARAVMYAVSQPAHVAVNEILIRPADQKV